MAIRNRRLWFLVHGWASLPLWALFCFVCVTGTVAVLSHEITWLTNPAARAANPDNLPRLPVSALTDAVQRELPEADISHVMVLEPYLVTVVSVSTPDAPRLLAYVNPYTAEVQSINSGLTFVGFMRALHGWLLFPWQQAYSWGYYLVGLMSLVTLTALATGVVVYKNFWHAFTRPRLRTGKGARVLLGDLHRLAGAWSLWFLLVIGVTGFWYLTQAILWDNDVEIAPHPPMLALEQLPPLGEPPARVPLAQALQQAQRALPELDVAWVSFPEHSRDNYLIAGRGDNVFFDQYAWRAYINPWDGEVSSVSKPANMGVLQTFSHIADPLHYGTLGGLWTKVLWFVFGVMLSGMSITGFVIWSKRTFRGAKKRTESLPEESFA
ncbi:MAG: PepSY domain-containing protein [Alcanivoracaceae bacterium]|jgi:uncharacterized iron-regulated membrane protein|nr:PepSY domain-containing protein [Alcanivoracaceae bacterium]